VSASADPKECPYVGLDPFESEHADYFFGRRRESKIIADHVLARPVTILYGPSGVGKSSILNVGLPAALKQMADADRDEADEGHQDSATAAPGVDGYFVIKRLRDWQDPGKAEQLMTAWATDADHRPVLVILDQFEEYFLYRERERMPALDRALGTLAARRDLPLHLLFGVRDDALHQLDQLRAFVPGILDTTIELRSLNDAGIQEAIRGPIERYNENYRKNESPIAIEDRLVTTLIRQLKEADTTMSKGRVTRADEGRVELPYLQLALTKLWTAEHGALATAMRESTLVGQLGGVGRIVRDHVHSVMGHLDAQEQVLCAKMFDRLVTAIGGKIAYPTAALAAPEVVGPGVSQQEVEAVLNKLTPKEARIIKPVVAGGLPGYEIFHDVLGLPVLEWKRDFEARQKEAALAREARRPMRRLRALSYVLLIGIIVGLVGWINQSYLAEQWRWFSVTRPFTNAQVRPYVLSAAKERALKPADSFKECASESGKDYCPEMVVVPAGPFEMGSPAGERGRSPDEGPQHPVTIGKAFAVSKYEVTFDEWDTCVDYGDCAGDIKDSGWGRGLQPVINVTWIDARHYAAWLAQMTGRSYRLLSEAEYEYAARAGSSTAYPWGDEIGKGNANCKGCGSRWDASQPAPVGSFAANAFGLYDMIGNVWQWLEDCYHSTYDGAPKAGSAWNSGCPDNRVRVFRGGSWSTPPPALRSASRGKNTTDSRFGSVGFRVGRTLTP